MNKGNLNTYNSNNKIKYNKENIDNLSTFQKIIFLQGLLKQLTSAKDRFEGIKEKMITKINNNCYNYYKSKIGMKQIYDYCESNDPQKYVEYFLYQDSKPALLNKYEIVYKIFFILRNSNYKLLKLINNSPAEYHRILSNFIVHFFYENTISNSMNNDELILIIYLFLEKLILKKLPDRFDYTLINKKFLNNNFEFNIIKQLTRRTDIRNFLCSILSDLILKVENYRDHLFIEIEKIDIARENKYIIENENESSILFDDPEFNISETKTNSNKKVKNKKDNKKNKNKLKDKLDQFLFIKDVAPINITRTADIYKSRKSIKLNQPKINLFDINIFDDNNDFERLQRFDEPSGEGGSEAEIRMVDKIFEENNVNIVYLKNKLKEYEKENNNILINNIMINYLENQINSLNKVNENTNKYSNSLINKAFEEIKKDYNMKNYTYLINTIKKNYEKITKFIKELLNILKTNINSIPHTIKCISNIIEILVEKKYKNISDYDKMMFKISFFMGNIIIPILSEPSFNGIITNEIISKITQENLSVIIKIFRQIISGYLFENSEEPEYTIFNKFIIEIIPEVFEIINNIQKNFELPEFIIKVFNTSDLIEDENRNINFDYFNENNNEKIQFQSVCFPLEILYIIIHLVIIEKDYFITKNNNPEEKQLFETLITYRVEIMNWCNNMTKNNKREFLFLSKINYQKTFEEKMNFILEKNYHELMLPNHSQKKENSILYEFKNCLLGVLAYVNIINKENFEPLIFRTDKKICNHKIINLLYQNQLNNKYKNTKFDLDYDENEIKDDGPKNTILDCEINHNNYNKELDFRKVLFPNIMNSIKYEIGFNLDIENNKKTTLFLSYLQLHFDDIPDKYSINNYSFLFSELIKETEELISLLNNTSILNQFHIKILDGNKLNSINNNHFSQIKNMEKCIYIQYLYNKISFLSKFKISDKKGIITKISYEMVQKNDTVMPNVDTIISLIEVLPDFRKYENTIEDIIKLEEEVEFTEALNNYFNDLKNIIKKEENLKKFSSDDLNSISIELENYILFKLYDKIYPSKSTMADLDFYKKCCCLDFVKPEHLIKNTKIVNEKLWKISMNYINQIDEKFTPVDKLKCFGKAFSILQNSITFCSGKDELGVDDTIPPLIYIFIKSKPKNLISNYDFCSLFLNPELSKKEYGIILSQIGLVMNVIKDMTYKDLIDITQEEFEKNYNDILASMNK